MIYYNRKLDYYPISIFGLDDGVSEVIFNLKTSGDGTYLLDAYYLSGSKVVKALDNAASASRPAFIDHSTIHKLWFGSFYPNNLKSTAPYVQTCLMNECVLYKFNDNFKRYVKTNIKIRIPVSFGSYTSTEEP